MICPKCETEFYGDNAHFCTECGTHLIRNRSIDELSIFKESNIKLHGNRERKDLSNSDKSKIDILIEQNTRIIELLENLNRSC
ncbi:MAG: hypothetical protein Q4P18_08055 [Methanobrevibacter sp.]|uniref:hypothetical protein n=1 Tax=Methanobrevibacter sp. TaxID=66852 RepID=UPI0026E01C27|nr:hypothetical protein [Methanobrevibacter sp.]MDO5849474.1 hypothetical protein [Methanobrevibacter sp.]